jgi:hypothetical protein
MAWAKTTRYPPSALSSAPMRSAYSRTFNQRITRYILAALVLGIIVFCEIRKQSLSSLPVKTSNLPSQRVHWDSHLSQPAQVHADPDDDSEQDGGWNENSQGELPRQGLAERPLNEPKPKHRDAEYGTLSTDIRSTIRPVVGKITISFGEPDAVFDRAIRSHEQHNKKNGYPQFVLRERVMSGLWSKHAYIISVLVQELGKPESERLRWLMSVSP